MNSMADATGPVNGIGHNSSLNDDIQRLDLSGFHLARMETLAQAVNDLRLKRHALRVLVAIIQSMHPVTRTSWITRPTLSTVTGMELSSVSNALSELRKLGYISDSERRPTPPDGTHMRHFTLTRLDPAQLEQALTIALEQVRLATERPDTSRPDVNSTSRRDVNSAETFTRGREPSRGDVNSTSLPAVNSTSSPDVNLPPASEHSPPGVKSEPVAYIDSRAGADLVKKLLLVDRLSPNHTLGDETSTCTAERAEPKAPKKPRENGSRLPANWVLPKPWGLWAVEHFECTREQVLSEAASFRDFWLSKSGAGATKVNWQLTWQNWIRSSAGRNRWKVKRVEVSAGPDLLDYGATASKTRHPLPRPDDVELDIETALRMMDGGAA